MADEDTPDPDVDRDGQVDRSPTDRPDPLPTPVLGEAGAPVRVMVFEDFACRGCRAFHENVLPKLRREYVDPGVVRYEHRDYPRPGQDDPEIHRAASAARAVQDELGDAAFYEYEAALFRNQGRLGLDLYADLATEVGADPDTVRRAARTRRYAETVERDREAGQQRDVGAVPAIYVEDEEFTGTTYAGLADLVEAHR